MRCHTVDHRRFSASKSRSSLWLSLFRSANSNLLQRDLGSPVKGTAFFLFLCQASTTSRIRWGSRNSPVQNYEKALSKSSRMYDCQMPNFQSASRRSHRFSLFVRLFSCISSRCRFFLQSRSFNRLPKTSYLKHFPYNTRSQRFLSSWPLCWQTLCSPCYSRDLLWQALNAAHSLCANIIQHHTPCTERSNTLDEAGREADSEIDVSILCNQHEYGLIRYRAAFLDRLIEYQQDCLERLVPIQGQIVAWCRLC